MNYKDEWNVRGLTQNSNHRTMHQGLKFLRAYPADTFKTIYDINKPQVHFASFKERNTVKPLI